MHQLIDITLIACSVCILILYPSIAYCRSIIKIRTLNGAINNGTGTTHLSRKNIQKIQRPKPKKTGYNSLYTLLTTVYLYITYITFILQSGLMLKPISCYTIGRTMGNKCTSLGRDDRYSTVYKMLTTVDLNQLYTITYTQTKYGTKRIF